MYNILHKVYHSVRSYANRLCEGIMDIIWYIFDMIGTIAFAISGALVGVARRMDIFGMAVLALATAIGGGIVRDVLLGYFPPNFVTQYCICNCGYFRNNYRIYYL